MSTNREDSERGTGTGMGAAREAAPRFRGEGDYAVWAARMHVYLQRNSAADIHARGAQMATEGAFTTLKEMVTQWTNQENEEAVARVLGAAAGAQHSGTHSAHSGSSNTKDEGSSSSTVQTQQTIKKPDAEDLAARKRIVAMVERSERVYGVIYGSIPQPLCEQAPCATGWAFGLWQWLKEKHESTESDAVNDLLTRWNDLRQAEGQTYDDWRSSVDRTRTLLIAAKEPPSASVYAHTLLYKLQPQYRTQVQALRAAGRLEPAASIDWDSVNRQINAHERSVQRSGEEEEAAAAGISMAAHRQQQQQRPQQQQQQQQRPQQQPAPRHGQQQGGDAGRQHYMENIQCYNCSEYGHIGRDCELPDKRKSRRTPKAKFRSRNNAEEEQASSAMDQNRYNVLGSEDDDEEVDWDRSYTARTTRAPCKKASQRAAVATKKNTESSSKKEYIRPTRETAAALASAMAAAAREENKRKAGAGANVGTTDALNGSAWGIDTMASLHLSGNKALFSGLRTCAPVHVKVADGGVVMLSQQGTITLRLLTPKGNAIQIKIGGVYYNDRITTNLLSWCVLRNGGWAKKSDKNETYLITPSDIKIPLSTKGRVSMLQCGTMERVFAGEEDDRRIACEACGHRQEHKGSLLQKSHTVREEDEDDEEEPQVHLAMCALKAMQTKEEEAGCATTEVAHAVTAGVEVLESRAPATYQEAVESKEGAEWQKAFDKEINNCEKHGVWTLVDRRTLPKNANIITCKWVNKIKNDENGRDTEKKARITPKGYLQKYGVDYDKVYARTGMYKTMRLGLSFAAKFDHELDQMDVPCAFLNADLEEEVYMELPEGYRAGREHLVCKLNKSLYGLKQAPRNWYLLVSKFIASLGFKPTISDPCLFHKRSATGRLMLFFLFVDDFQISYHIEDKEEWDVSKKALIDRFETKDMGESKWILGMRITRNRAQRTITLDQELYATKALEKYGLTQCKIVATPGLVGHQDEDEEMKKPADRDRFMEITGTLMYLAISTRPDMAHEVNHLASKMVSPTKKDMSAAERILRYLAGTKDVALIFGSRNGGAAAGDSRGRATQQTVEVCAYADADWANCKETRRSITGWVAKLNGDPVSWASKKQRTVALSTCEAELYAEAAAIQEVLWLRGVCGELGLHSQTGSIVYGDNQSAIAVSENGVKGERTKHVDIKYHFITETVEQGSVKLKWIPSKEQQADIFTKTLGAPIFEALRKTIMTR